MTTTLYIFSGLPGTGKSALAVALARSKNAAYLRLDTIEQAIKNSTQLSVGPEGYEVAYALAFDNLRNGLDVVADSVNSLAITRRAWHETALAADSSFVDIEVVCSDTREHKRRVEGRKSAINGLTLPTWQQVISRDYAKWTSDRIIVDTAGELPQESVSKLLSALGERLRAVT